VNGRILAERLLATTSVAVLALVVISPEADAACTAVNGGSFVNNSTVSCIAVTGNSVSVTNSASGVVGPAPTAIAVNSGVTVSGAIMNAGSITAQPTGVNAIGINVAGAVLGGITNSSTISASGIVTVTGINISSSASFPGALSNSGTIAAVAANTSSALAAGLFFQNGTFSGGVTNSGTISAAATIVSGAATATGILICDCVASFGGGISNSGTISATVIATGTTGASMAAVGIFAKESRFDGGIKNSGTISASVSSNGSGLIRAGAIVLDSTVTSFNGGIANNATITAAANGFFAVATGIAILAKNVAGGVINTSTVAANATSSVAAAAVGLGVGSQSLFSPPSLTTSFGGGITNSGGTISARATGGLANAAAVLIDTRSFVGDMANSGTLSAFAQATATGVAFGVAVNTSSTFAGNITNSGTISAVMNANSRASVAGIGIGLGRTVTRFTGGVTNSGTVSASAAAIGFATATGIAIHVRTFNASVVNSSSISAIASGSSALGIGLGLYDGTYLGGIVNSGSVGASAMVATGAGAAKATGILLCGCVGPFNSGILNSGTIRATAQSQVTATAYGMSLNSTTFLGGITNSNTISATANAARTAAAVGVGIGLETAVSLLSGGITNSGTISASATGTGGTGKATATGIAIFATSLSGNISNSAGTIAAVAQVARGTANAFGLRIETGTVFAGNIVNSGLISVAGTVSGGLSSVVEVAGIRVAGQGMSGTISNSGTITAAANQGTVRGILVSSFTGTIVNSGTISGTVAGTGSGVGIGMLSSAGTILNTGTIGAGTWAINLAAAAGANTINQNGGSIVGPTSGSGGAIRFSANGDTLNINGGTIIGNIAGTGGAAPTVNIQPGAGNTFSYAGVMSGIGSVNFNSGSLVLPSAAAINTTNYDQSAGTTLALAVAPALSHASVSASGTVLVASGAVLEVVEVAAAWTPGTYNYGAVVTGGTINGSFTTISSSPFFVANLSQSSTVDNLTLTMLSPAQVPGLNSSQQSVANAIIGIPGGNATLDQLFTLSNPGPALTQLSGVQFTSTNYQPLIVTWQAFSSSLSDRLSQGGDYGGTANASYDPSHGIQFAQANIPQVVPATDAETRALRGAPPAQPHQWGLWARGYGLSSTAPSTATSSPYSESGAGLIIGADNQISERIVAGGALNISTDKANVSGGGFTQTNAYQGSAYGQYAIDPNWYVNGIAGFGWQTYKTQRVVSFFGTNVNNGSFDGQSYQLYAETGYALHPAFLPQTRVTPYLGLGYLHAHTNGFTETGSTTVLSVQAMDPNSFTTTLGARAAATLQIGTTVFRPELRAGWQHEFLDAAATMRAAFATAPGSVFTATGTGFGRESFLGGAGMTTTITSSTQVFFDYDAKVNGGYTAQAVSGGLRVQF